MNIQAFYLACIAALMCACGSASEVARSTLAIAATGVREVDAREAELYTQAAREALDASSTLQEYESRMRDHNAVADALVVSHSALLAAESALDAGDASSIAQTISCLLGTLSELATALRVAGIELPDALRDAISLASGFAGVCHE